MKIVAAVALLILSGTRVATVQNILSTPDAEVLVAVLEQAVIPDSIRNWALDPKVNGLVVSTATVLCALPIGADERLRQNAALERAANGETVGPSPLIAKPPARDKDLLVAPGHVVPRIMVARCLSSAGARLPPMSVNAVLRLEWESPTTIAKEFRAANPVPWVRRHPNTAGVVRLAKPVFSEDRSHAGAYFSRLKNGVGGAGVFCMLTYEGTWKLLWQETVWLE